MIILQGKNLCERQKEVNFKVKEAVLNKIEFEDARLAQEKSDIDRLFKIDLASNHRNIDYIIEQLKCGDSLYISRALKCEWIYDNDYVHIINPDYLHHHIFSTMSLKMKKKTLTTISIYVRDETRAQLFFEYCVNSDLTNNAYKFLIFTNEFFKAEFLNNEDNFNKIYRMQHSNLKDLIGNSFVLADIFCKNGGSITDLSYLYSLNDVEYLKLLETRSINKFGFLNISPLGGKTSRNILKKFKSTILENPLLYLKVLKKSELLKYTSSDEAKVYAVSLLPEDANSFWRMDYYKTNKYILDLVKTDSIYTYVKNIFSNKYPNEEFEMAGYFYKLQYYKFMTVKERENWALMHLDKQTGVIPEEEDYRWYEFVEFAQAFEDIKRKILIATHASKRSAMLIILIKSAKNQKELVELLNYYYKRHVNEKTDLKESFIEDVIKHHKVFEFDDACWTAFDKLLHSLNLYIPVHTYDYRKKIFLDVSLVYHISNKKAFPNALHKHLMEIDLNRLKQQTDQLSEEKGSVVYEYIFQFFVDKIKDLENLYYNSQVQVGVRHTLKQIIQWKRMFKKEGEYPEIVLKYMKLDSEHFDDIVGLKEKPKAVNLKQVVTEGFLIRCLKQDPAVILEHFTLLQEKMATARHFRINMLLKKIKLYFSHDLAKQYLDLCTTTLLNMTPDKWISRDIIFASVFAIFQLGDESIKCELMDKYAPTSGKIEYNKIDGNLLAVQEAICRFHWYSRPPVPLSKTTLYLKGDYVHYMHEMFNMYLMNLTPTLRTEFINFTLDSPVSIQKKGLRLAFQVFETGVIKDIVSNVWKKTKNVSVRSNLYQRIGAKIIKEKGKSQLDLFQLLKELTASLHQDDDEEVFIYLWRNNIPEYLRGSYLEIALKTVSGFPEKKSNIERRTYVIKAIEENMSLIDETYIESLVNDHIRKRLLEQKLNLEKNHNIAQLNKALWKFVAEYIVSIPTEDKQKKSLDVMKVIVNECLNNWNETYGTEEYIYQLFFNEFLRKLHMKIHFRTKYTKNTIIYSYLLETFEAKFGVAGMYYYYWDWKLSLLTRTVIDGSNDTSKDANINFGLQLGMLVKELKEKHCYYTSFLDKILGIISKYTNILRVGVKTLKSLTDYDVKVLIAYGLTLSGMFDAYVLALRILPDDLSINTETEDKFGEVIRSIKEQNNDELRAIMNDKFIYTDHKVRKIMI